MTRLLFIAKKKLNFQDLLTNSIQAKTAQNAEQKTFSQNVSKNTLHITCVLLQFCHFNYFCDCSRIVCSGLDTNKNKLSCLMIAYISIVIFLPTKQGYQDRWILNFPRYKIIKTSLLGFWYFLLVVSGKCFENVKKIIRFFFISYLQLQL